MWAVLRLLGLPRTTVAIQWFASPERERVDAGAVREIAGAANAAATRVLGESQCLVRSLVLKWLLARRGVRSEIRIGVRREGERLIAHAWVERNGEPINDSIEAVRKYAAFEAEGGAR